MKLLLIFCLTLSLNASSSLYYFDGNKIVTVQQTTVSTPFAGKNAKYYKTSNDQLLSTDNKLIIKFSVGADITFLVNKFNMEIVEMLGKDLYLFNISETSNTFELSSLIQEENHILFAHPNFIRPRSRR